MKDLLLELRLVRAFAFTYPSFLILSARMRRCMSHLHTVTELQQQTAVVNGRAERHRSGRSGARKDPLWIWHEKKAVQFFTALDCYRCRSSTTCVRRHASVLNEGLLSAVLIELMIPSYSYPLAGYHQLAPLNISRQCVLCRCAQWRTDRLSPAGPSVRPSVHMRLMTDQGTRLYIGLLLRRSCPHCHWPFWIMSRIIGAICNTFEYLILGL